MEQTIYPSFPKILRMLANQSGEDKLRIAFGLSALVRQVREAGKQHAKNNQQSRPRRAS